MVGPATLPELAAAIDPQGPHVLLSAHAPTAGSTWTEWLLPLTADVAVEPRRLRVANLSYDVLFNTQDFCKRSTNWTCKRSTNWTCKRSTNWTSLASMSFSSPGFRGLTSASKTRDPPFALPATARSDFASESIYPIATRWPTLSRWTTHHSTTR
jgi:hypothetical protein